MNPPGHVSDPVTPVATGVAVPSALPGLRAYRLASIDLLRGLVIVIMALDHVRDFVMVGAEMDPLADPNVGVTLFFTRWITHFCAPVFVFLAGTSAGLMASRKTQSELGSFLLKRGLWLIVIECFVISTAWTFAPGGIAEMGGLVLVGMQVIWAIGASMVVLAGAQFLGRRACALLGGLVLLSHNLLDAVWPATELFEVGPLWAALHSQTAYVVGPFFLGFVYPLLPWVGVMLLGYGSASIFEKAPEQRDRILLTAGVGAVLFFIALRAAEVYGDPNPWQADGGFSRTLIDFLNTTKYPPSLLYLLMTLGPAAIFCSVAERRLPQVVRRPLVVFGRVPFAFYVAHLYLIHTLAIGLGVAQGFQPSQFLTLSAFFPEGYGIGLAGVYLVWMLVILLLYPFCKWMADLKERRRDWWLSYL